LLVCKDRHEWCVLLAVDSKGEYWDLGARKPKKISPVGVGDKICAPFLFV